MEPLIIILIALGALSLVTLFWLGVNASRKNAALGLFVLLLSPLSAVIYGISHWKDARYPFVAYCTSLVSAISVGVYLLHASGTWQVMHTSLHLHQAHLSKAFSDRDALTFTPVSLAQLNRITPGERQQRRLQLMQDFVDRYEPSFTEDDREEINRVISRLMYGSTVNEEQKQQLVELQRRVANRQMRAVAKLKAEVEKTAAKPVARKDIFRKESRREAPTPNYRLEFLPITAREASGHVGKMFMVKRTDGTEKKYRLIGTSPGALRFERSIPGGKYSFEYKYREIEKLRILAQVAY